MSDLANTEVHPNRDIAHLLAVAAGYAYGDSVEAMKYELKKEFTLHGVEDKNLRVVKYVRQVDTMLIESTAYLVQSGDGRVAILCYRGTRPFAIVSWLGSLDSDAKKVNFPQFPGPSSVHAGFYRNFLATHDEIMEALERALNGESIDPEKPEQVEKLEALYITGHSLGGAMAALMAVTLLTGQRPLYSTIKEKLRAVYTFGQPMVGDSEFAAECEELDFLKKQRRMIRFVYRQDAAPHLPSRLVGGEFKQFGVEYRYQDDGPWEFSKESTRRTTWGSLTIPLAALESKIKVFPLVPAPLEQKINQFWPARTSLRRFLLSFDDHAPQNYIDTLAAPAVLR